MGLGFGLWFGFGFGLGLGLGLGFAPMACRCTRLQPMQLVSTLMYMPSAQLKKNSTHASWYTALFGAVCRATTQRSHTAKRRCTASPCT